MGAPIKTKRLIKTNSILALTCKLIYSSFESQKIVFIRYINPVIPASDMARNVGSGERGACFLR